MDVYVSTEAKAGEGVARIAEVGERMSIKDLRMYEVKDEDEAYTEFLC